MKVTLAPEERAAAHRALRELEDGGFVTATHTDALAPFDWLEITDVGRRALERGALDELDQWLREIDAHLVGIRQGAWAAVYSAQPDTTRQAAHSGRELIRQVLDRLAPDTEVRTARWFSGDKVTRHDRLKLILQKRAGRISESTLRVIEAQCDVVEASYQRLSAVAHTESGHSDREHVSELLRAADAALADLLRADHAEELG